MRPPARSLALALLAASTAVAEEPRGFVELRGALFPGAAGDKLQVVERARPTFQAELSKRVKLVATVEAGFAQGRDTATVLDRVLRQSELGPLYEAAACEPTPHENGTLRIDSAHDYLEVDRLYVDLYDPRVDVRVGRQALTWGSARFFNPTDPFPQVLLTEPWRPRRGVNALRVTVPFGQVSDVTAVVAGNDTFTGLRAAGRVRVNWKGTDFALVGGWRGEGTSAYAGVDVRGTAVVGFWFEGAWVFPSSASSTVVGHEELAAGLDYSFPVLEQLVVFAQYSRNGSGLVSPNQYASATSRLAGGLALSCASTGLFGAPRPADPFAPFTIGREYVLAGASLGVLPELSASLTALANANDGTGLVLPVVSWAALDWLDVSASASIPFLAFGSGGEFKPRAQDLRVAVTTPQGTLHADLSGLVPAFTVTLWTRASF